MFKAAMLSYLIAICTFVLGVYQIGSLNYTKGRYYLFVFTLIALMFFILGILAKLIISKNRLSN